MENWKPIIGYVGRYEISDLGRIKAVSFMQRYLLRNGVEAYRCTREKISSTQSINSGYLIVHLNLNSKRKACLVHRLVAAAFCEGEFFGREVNHKNGVKLDNCAANLEWVTRTANHLHAVALGLNKQAIPVTDPSTGRMFNSITQAAKGTGKAHRTIKATFILGGIR